MELKTENHVRSKRELSKDAIALALKGEWEHAAEVNQAILDLFPGDVEAMNRLGKALMELAQYSKAREVLGQVVGLSPYNTIAKKNLARLDQLESVPASGKQVRKAGGVPQLFIEESGKSGTTVLQKPASGRIVAAIAPGDPASLVVKHNAINVHTRDDEYLGRVEPKLGRRLIRLIEGGNRYEAAIIGVNDHGISIIIRETYRHPSLHNVCSFPTKSKEEHRVYLGDSLFHYADEESDLDEDDEEGAIVDEAVEEDSEWEE